MAGAQPSLEDCKLHLQTIADQLTCNDFVREGFQGALDLIAADLYKDSSHFLLELIQNADDNIYGDGVIPTSIFFYRRDGFLFFTCNEKGFTEANLRAICSANRSTKTLNKGKTGVTGEKGVGFKSIYKLPEAYRANTMFSIKIEKRHHQDAINDQLRELCPSILLFLRRLTQIRVIYADEQSNVISETVLDCLQHSLGHIRRATTTRTTDASSSESSQYLLSEYVVKDMPDEEKRKNIKESTISLAFPVDENDCPILDEQQVYAFLPICRSGLSFLVQADFLLVSSRQDIDTSKPWNRRLRDRLVHALIEAFSRLNSTKLRYTWPTYVPRKRRGCHQFLASIVDELFKPLREAHLLESWQGNLSTPNSLCFVPNVVLDEEGQPLIMGSNFLSPQYRPEDLQSIVTKTFGVTEFINLFKWYIAKHKDEFRGKANGWHSKTSKVIMDAMQIAPNADDMARMAIIPMDNGFWTFSNKKKIYLPDVQGDVPLPAGIEITTIDPTAAKDSCRRKLYLWLGAKVLGYEDISREVIRIHESHKSRPDISLDHLLSHTRYLFHTPAGQHLPHGLSTKLWVADTQSIPRHGVQLYMDDPGSNIPVSEYFRSNPNIAPFIHKQYLALYEKELGIRDRWLNWLQKALGISASLRLATEDKKEISPEFRYIIKNNPSQKWLVVLRDNYLKKTPPKDEQSVREQVGMMPVTCIDASLAKLNDTLLPTLPHDSLSVEAANMSFVDLEDVTHHYWHRIAAFGVITVQDHRYPLRILLGWQRAGFCPSRAQIGLVYKDVIAKSGDLKAQDFVRPLDFSALVSSFEIEDIWHGCEIRESPKTVSPSPTRSPVGNTMKCLSENFKSRPLVYTGGGRWIDLRDCCWDAPDCLRKLISLKRVYSDLQPLFKGILGVKDASLDDIVAELIEHDGDMNSIDFIKPLLFSLSDRLPKVAMATVTAKTETVLHQLEKHRVIPVMGKDGQVMLVTPTDRRWYIPDRKSYVEAFERKVHLLDFSQREQERLENLMAKLQLASRKISKNVVEETIMKGRDRAVLNAKCTNSYRSKAQYLLSLASEFEEPRLTPMLTSLEVYGVDSIILRRSIRTSSNNMVSGTDQIGDVVVENGLKVFVSKTDLSKNEINTHSLAGRICYFANIPNNYRDVIATILSLNSERHIESYLERENIKFEKRVRAVLNIKLIDNSAGMIIPQSSTAFITKVSTTMPGATSESAFKTPQTDRPSTTNDSMLAKTNSTLPSRALPAKDMIEPAYPQANRNAPKITRAGMTGEGLETESMQRELQSTVNANNRLHLGPVNFPRVKVPAIHAAISSQVPPLSHIQTVVEAPSKKIRKPLPMPTVLEPCIGQRSFGPARSALALPDERIHHLSDGDDDVSPSSSPPFLTPQPSRSTLVSRGGSTTPDTSMSSDTEVVRIGEQGEWVVYKFLKGLVGDDFEESCWTSLTCALYTNTHFEGDESECADFTLRDKNGLFTEWLIKRGHQQAQSWRGYNIIYHLEVKSTYGPSYEGFHMSQNQLDLARQWQMENNKVPNDVYVVLRVHSMTGKVGVLPYVDPATMFEDGTLSLIAPDGYHVFTT